MRIKVIPLFRFLLPKQTVAITLWPFIVFKDKKYSTNNRVINHEMIHLRQQLELLIFPFYLIYILEYLVLLIIYRNHHQAYSNISFEKEAYNHDKDRDYLKNRKFWAVWRQTR